MNILFPQPKYILDIFFADSISKNFDKISSILNLDVRVENLMLIVEWIYFTMYIVLRFSLKRSILSRDHMWSVGDRLKTTVL